MQIGKQWQHLAKHSVNECVLSQQSKPHTPKGTGKLSVSVGVCLASLAAFLVSFFNFLFFSFFLHLSHTTDLLDCLRLFLVCFP